MDASQWLLVAGISVAVSAGVFSSQVSDKLVAARFVASARRRAIPTANGGRTLGVRQAITGLAGSTAGAWSSTPMARFVPWRSAISTAVGLAVGSAAALAFSSAPVGGALALAICVGSAHVQRTRADRNLEELRAQLPQLFTVLASSVGAGLSLAQAFSRAEQACDPPISVELRAVNSAIALGVPLPDALEQFANRSSVPELRAVAVGLGIQHTAGGGLVRILEHASHQLRQGEALRRSIRSHTAQGRMTLRMVTIVPIGLAVLLAVLSDDYLSVFMGTPSGRALLGLAIGLEALGIYAVSRLLRVEV